MATPSTTVTVTGESLIDGAFDLIGVKDPSEDIDQKSTNDALRRLNAMVDSWGTQRLTIPFVARQVYPVTSGQATYTIWDDPSADFQAQRPTTVSNAGLLLTSVTPNVEIARALITDDEYAAITIKDLQSNLFLSVYYNATYPAGQVTLWPVPLETNPVVLYVPQAVAGFPNLTDQFIFPPGYAEALEYNLALRLAAPYGRPIPPDVATLARIAMINLKTLNVKPQELQIDAALQPAASCYSYNILTDTGA